jgi:hemerythrin
MALITWTDSYSTGIITVDTQHKILIALLNELHEAMARGSANQVLDEVLDRLVAYARAHFADEERLMRSAAYPKLPAHQAEHASLTKQAAALQDQFRAGRVGISIEVLRFLRDWLQSHILASDKAFGRYIAQTHGTTV